MYINSQDADLIKLTTRRIVDGELFPTDCNGKHIDSIMDYVDSLGSAHEKNKYWKMAARVVINPIVKHAWHSFNEVIPTLTLMNIDWEPIWEKHVTLELIKTA